MKKKFSKKILVAYVLIFTAGIFVGQAVAFWAIKSAAGIKQIDKKMGRKHKPGKMEKKLAEKLDLNKEQSEKLKSLLGEMRKKIRKENGESRKKIRKIINDTFNNIETVLDADQKNKFRKLKKRLPVLNKKGRSFGRHFREHNREAFNN